MEKMNFKTFLGANSFEGFVSFFDKCYLSEKGWKAYIIKGGPGTGKSSFMKKVVKTAEGKGYNAELCPCSSDPDSLDAVIFPEIKTVIMDGTSPHTVDPFYPGACEQILNFGEFWDSDKLRENSDKIITLTNKNKFLHRIASGYLKAAKQLMTDNLNIINKYVDKNKLENFSRKLCQKYIPKKYGIGFEWVRFLEGITPKGVISLANEKITENMVVIEDSFGIVSDKIINHIRLYALSNGYDIITIKNAFLPSSLLDGIIIPELSLSFLRESEHSIFQNTRKIHSKRFMDIELLKAYKNRVKTNKKTINSLISFATDTLKDAKSVHDQLESCYISAMDFESLNLFAENIAKKLF